MSPLRTLLLAVCALWFVTGCEMNRVMTVKRDGSGQIAEHFMGPRDSFASDQPPKPDEKTPPQFKMPRPTAELLAKNTGKLGEGVTVKTFKPIETKDSIGYDAVYEFADITKLHADAFLQQQQGMNPPGGVPVDNASRNFKFTKGAVAELIVPIKPYEPKGTSITPGNNSDPKQREGFFEAMKHMHLRTAIRVEGKIEETNAKFREGEEVVLSELNLKGMSADPKYADAFKKAAEGITEMKEPPVDEKYVKKEAGDVKIRFK